MAACPAVAEWAKALTSTWGEASSTRARRLIAGELDSPGVRHTEPPLGRHEHLAGGRRAVDDEQFRGCYGVDFGVDGDETSPHREGTRGHARNACGAENGDRPLRWGPNVDFEEGDRRLLGPPLHLEPGRLPRGVLKFDPQLIGGAAAAKELLLELKRELTGRNAAGQQQTLIRDFLSRVDRPAQPHDLDLVAHLFRTLGWNPEDEEGGILRVRLHLVWSEEIGGLGLWIRFPQQRSDLGHRFGELRSGQQEPTDVFHDIGPDELLARSEQERVGGDVPVGATGHELAPVGAGGIHTGGFEAGDRQQRAPDDGHLPPIPAIPGLESEAQVGDV